MDKQIFEELGKIYFLNMQLQNANKQLQNQLKDVQDKINAVQQMYQEEKAKNESQEKGTPNK